MLFPENKDLIKKHQKENFIIYFLVPFFFIFISSSVSCCCCLHKELINKAKFNLKEKLNIFNVKLFRAERQLFYLISGWVLSTVL